MTRLHGMLEFDKPSTQEEFSGMFVSLLGPCEIPAEVIAGRLHLTTAQVAAWSQAEELPSQSEWLRVTEEVMELLWDLVEGNDFPVFE